jgi:hypothetical protein
VPALRDSSPQSTKAQRLWKTLRPGDLLVVVVVVALAVALWGAAGLASGTATGAVLVHDGTTVRTFTLAELRTDATFAFESEGYHYTIRTGGGRIRFETADCPDRVCVQTGWIGQPPQVAACVPGHLLLRVTGKSGDVDVFSG